MTAVELKEREGLLRGIPNLIAGINCLKRAYDEARSLDPSIGFRCCDFAPNDAGQRDCDARLLTDGQVVGRRWGQQDGQPTELLELRRLAEQAAPWKALVLRRDGSLAERLYFVLHPSTMTTGPPLMSFGPQCSTACLSNGLLAMPHFPTNCIR